MKISFHGAARTVTGSKHIVHMNNGKQILLDCGMFQGMGEETLTLNKEWGFIPSDLTYVIISHAHIDHVGLLPKLVKEGYKGTIYCTDATADLMRILLMDSARIQEGDATHINKGRRRDEREEVEPLYIEDDVEKVMPMLHILSYDQPFDIDDEVQLMYTDCGHILGSAAIHLKLKENGKETRITFSGDVGRYGDDILRKPEVFPQADYILIESTYGDRLHDHITPSADKLLNHIVHTCLEKRGKLIIPAFSVGRTQELLYMLNQLETEHRLPPVNYYVDSPLSIEATRITKRHPECFNDRVQALLRKDQDVFDFKGLLYTKDVEGSKALNDLKDPCVIISASGMAEAGRIKHHIKNNISDKRNTILIVGYCEPRSLGGRLRNGADEVGIFGVKYPVVADVEVIESLSAHGDYNDLSQWLACQDPSLVKKLFLVHGDYDVQERFKDRLLKKGFRDIEIPERHQTIGLG